MLYLAAQSVVCPPQPKLRAMPSARGTRRAASYGNVVKLIGAGNMDLMPGSMIYRLATSGFASEAHLIK